MIRMVQSISAGHAKAYFSDALAKADYYLNDQELQGRFNGNIAYRLGIVSKATKETFFDLCENMRPGTGQPLTPRTIDQRTVGYDINFHCPKSVSLVHVLSGDDHILKAFEASVTATMKEIEVDSMTRVRKKGQYSDRQTGELVWAEFTHQTARPVEDLPPDPHLHSHCFVFNVTWDDEEKQFKAGQFRDIKRDMPYYQARFHKRFSDNLIKLGYNIRKTSKSFEIEGVPQEAINLFSKRTDEIGRAAKEKGITDAAALDALGARTRAKKQKGLSMKELISDWRKQIQDIEKKSGGENKPIRHSRPPKQPELEARTCVDHALSHSFERASVAHDRRVLESAYKYSIGNASVDLDGISEWFKNDRRIIRVKEHGKTMCTTHGVLQEEKRMVELARQGQGKMKPLYYEAPELKVKGEHAVAATHVLTTPHRVSIISGSAGAGKTKMTQELVEHIEHKDKTVTMLASSSEASRGVLRSQGFENAETVARFLVDKKMQDAIEGQVVVVDEAGMLGTKDTLDLLEVTTKKNARIVFIGDTRQHSSVLRGDALRVLNTVGGIRSAQVSKIYRQQKAEYNEAATHLSKGNIKAGFDKLDEIGSIKEIDPLNPNTKLADDYVAAVKEGKTVLIISPTHKQGEALTDEIRQRLKAAKLIGKKEIKATRLINTNMTQAEKADWKNYKNGLIVQFSQNTPSIKRGSVWSVGKIDKQAIEIINDKKEIRQLPINRSEAFSVYEKSEVLLAKGDRVRITNSGFDKAGKRLDSGLVFDVTGVNRKGKISLRNREGKTTYEIDKEHGHIAHAHCITSHASQGKTVDEVFISQPAATFPATNAKQFYVSVTRGKYAVHIYTDDKLSLLAHASQIGDRQSAIELVEREKKHDLHLAHELNQQSRTNNNAEPTTPTSQSKSHLNRDYEI